MEPTKDSKKDSKKTKTTAPVETTPLEVGENIDKDATVVAGQAGDEPVTVVMNPPKKHKVGIIVGIVVFLLFLIGGISLAVWYFCIYNSSDVVAYDAMRQFVSAEHISAGGTIRIASSEPDEDGHTTVAEVIFTSNSMRIPNRTFVSLDISERDRDDKVVDGHQILLGLNFTILSDGTIYFQTDGLTESIDMALAAQNTDLEDLDEMSQFAYGIAELLDKEWWQISLGDITDELELDDAVSEPVNDFYNCILAATRENADLAKLYDAHRFVEIARTNQAATTSGATRYQVTLGYEQLADFINTLPETTGGEKALVCYNNLADEFDFKRITAKDLPKVKAKDFEKALPSDYQLFLEISDFGHQLKRIEVTGTTNGVKFDGFFDFNYAAIEVAAPSDYRPITDLFEDVFELFGEYFYGFGYEPGPQGSGVIFI